MKRFKFFNHPIFSVIPILGFLFLKAPITSAEEKVFDATLNMKRIPFTLGNLLKQVARFPFITLLVVFRIHWQAFKLWLKKAPYFIHPDKIKLMKGN